jgi:hypothetical protein
VLIDITGLALGIEDTMADATTVFVAILAHKFFTGSFLNE